MRWFKLLSRWDADDWLESLACQFGAEGLGWYILCLSIIAEGMDGSDKCSRSVSWQTFKARLRVDNQGDVNRRLIKFMLSCQGHIDFSVTIKTGEILKVCPESAESLSKVCGKSGPSLLKVCTLSCPKLLKYRDETSKKSGRAQEQELELDLDKIQRIESSSVQPCQTKLLEMPDPIKVVFDSWQSLPGVTHSRRLSGHEGPIRAAIEYLGDPDKVVVCCQRYSHVMVNAEGKYRPVYSWGINDFLSRRGHYNLDRFIRENWEDEFLAWHTSRQFKTVEQLTEDL